MLHCYVIFDGFAGKEKLPKNVLKSKLDLWFTEEELYVKGNIVVWSKGLMEQTGCSESVKRTICSYCSQNPVKQALWCTFHCKRPNFNSNSCEVQNTEKRLGTPMPSICIIDTQTIKVFTSNHEDFINSLPFNVTKAWNTKYGIFLVREDDGKNIFFIFLIMYTSFFFRNFPKTLLANTSSRRDISCFRKTQWIFIV